MGEIADTMRSALRQLAQADALLYSGLAEELDDGATAGDVPPALIQPQGGAPATEAQLLALKNDALQELCAQRGGRRVVAVSSSVSAMDALRARIRAQSKTVADYIAADPEAQGFIDDWATPEPITR